MKPHGGAIDARRRALLAASALAPLGALCGCDRPTGTAYGGAWVGASHERGHLVRAATADSKATYAPSVVHRTGAVVVGAGVAGLAAARALIRGGVDDICVLDLEDQAGGNSRGHSLGGMRCPLGAHYLPLPGEQATEVIELLDELRLRRLVAGRAVYDERMLCHSPQERLFIGGAWREGLLPPVDALPASQRAATLAQYRRFSAAVAEVGRGGAFALPTARSRWAPALDALDATTFAAWLGEQGFDAPALRWYLDYCCRDDYGAGAAQVSAWAGLHYFASRHGFRDPGADAGRGADAGEGVLTWPEGNAWLAGRLAAPLGERLHPGFVVLRVHEERDSATVDAWNVSAQRLERWTAPQVVMATPLFVAARLLETPPAALVAASRAMRHAPWLVANLLVDRAIDDRPGAPPSWDNVFYGSPSLGYVDATHQSLLPFAGPTVLTSYWALGGDSAEALGAGRASLLADDWQRWSSRVVTELRTAHPDLPDKLRRVDLMRYGHAMSVPLPGVRSHPALRALAEPQRRVQFAHADLSGYSVFEESLYHGTRAGRAATAALAG
ncbi:MAG: NAD(P)-binding protein [Caldimonas sp.]